MSFDGPNKILPIFHHFLGWTQIKIFPFQNLMSFDGSIGSIIKHEVYKGFQSFLLSKPDSFWWTHYSTKNHMSIKNGFRGCDSLILWVLAPPGNFLCVKNAKPCWQLVKLGQSFSDVFHNSFTWHKIVKICH